MNQAKENRLHAVITGGASGIGKATCNALARRGYVVCVADLNESTAQEVATSCGGFAVRVDVSDEASVEALFAQALDRFEGRLNALVTAAGIVDSSPLLEASARTFARVYAINTIGTFLCIREAAKRMQAGGRICTVGSVSGKRGGGGVGTAAYAASKGAVMALTRTAARELAPRGIFVNGVNPGPTETPMVAASFVDEAAREHRLSRIPLGRVAEPTEIAEAIAWILSDGASFVLGEMLSVDGGILMD